MDSDTKCVVANLNLEDIINSYKTFNGVQTDEFNFFFKSYQQTILLKSMYK